MRRRFWVVGFTLTVILFCVMVLWSFSVSANVWEVGWPTPFWTYACTGSECVTDVFRHGSFWLDIGALAAISFLAAFWYDKRKR